MYLNKNNTLIGVASYVFFIRIYFFLQDLYQWSFFSKIPILNCEVSFLTLIKKKLKICRSLIKLVGNPNFGVGRRPIASILSLAYIAVVLSFFDTLRYRFAEIYYRRGESSSHKGRGMRVDTVVLFVPDVWSCLPTRVEWDGMIAAGSCKKQLLQQKHPEEMMEAETQALTHYLVSFLFTFFAL